MRKALCALALVLALGTPALAREILTPAPQPPPPQSTQETTDGEMHYPLVQLILDLFALI